MPRSFRFEPPEPRPGSADPAPAAPRALLGRWEHRVTVVVGGPGLGKTTLLAQAIAENRLAPRGRDVWIGVVPRRCRRRRPGPRRVAAAVVAPVAGAAADRRRPGRRAGRGPGPAAVAEAVWRQSPTAVCLVVDDVHWLPAGSPGAGWLAGLIDALPANGHVLVTSRWSAGDPAGPAVQPGAGPAAGRGRAAVLRGRARRLRRAPGTGGRAVQRHRRLAGHGRAHRQRRGRPDRRLPVGGGPRAPRAGPPPGAGHAVRPGRRRRRPRGRCARRAGRPGPRPRRRAAGSPGCGRRLADAPPAVAVGAGARPRPRRAAGRAAPGRRTHGGG